jgi:hypothetical protein
VAQGRIAKRRDNIGGARQLRPQKVVVEARDAVDADKECRGGSRAAVSVGARITRVILAQQHLTDR